MKAIWTARRAQDMTTGDNCDICYIRLEEACFGEHIESPDGKCKRCHFSLSLQEEFYYGRSPKYYGP
jgi:hypothetical protein